MPLSAIQLCSARSITLVHRMEEVISFHIGGKVCFSLLPTEALPQRREVPTNSGSVFICRSSQWLVWFKLLIFCFKNLRQDKKKLVINVRSIVRNEIVTLLCEGLHPAPQMGKRASQGVLRLLLRSNSFVLSVV